MSNKRKIEDYSSDNESEEPPKKRSRIEQPESIDVHISIQELRTAKRVLDLKKAHYDNVIKQQHDKDEHNRQLTIEIKKLKDINTGLRTRIRHLVAKLEGKRTPKKDSTTTKHTSTTSKRKLRTATSKQETVKTAHKPQSPKKNAICQKYCKHTNN